MAHERDGVQPEQAEANRSRMQGGGSGQRELDAQQDPGRPAGGEGRSFMESDEISQTGTNPQEASAHIVEGGDQYDFDGRDNPQEDGGEPSGGMHHGENHTRWPDRTEALRGGQGPKTRARTKEINSGGL